MTTETITPGVKARAEHIINESVPEMVATAFDRYYKCDDERARAQVLEAFAGKTIFNLIIGAVKHKVADWSDPYGDEDKPEDWDYEEVYHFDGAHCELRHQAQVK